MASKALLWFVLSSAQEIPRCRHGNVVNVADMVTIDEGPHKGKMASVRAIVRGSLFLYSRLVSVLLMQMVDSLQITYRV